MKILEKTIFRSYTDIFLQSYFMLWKVKQEMKLNIMES